MSKQKISILQKSGFLIGNRPFLYLKKIIKEAEKTLSQINKAANKAEGKERKELRQIYNQSVKEVVDLLDGVGKE